MADSAVKKEPGPPIIPIGILGIGVILLLIAGVMMTISANKIKESAPWRGNDADVQTLYTYAAIAAGLSLATFIILVLVIVLYLVSGGLKTAKATRKSRADSKKVISFSPFLLGGIVVALLITIISGILAIMVSSGLSDRTSDDTLASAYTYAVIAAIVTIGGVGALIMGLFGIVALRNYHKKSLAKGLQAADLVVTSAPAAYVVAPSGTDETFPVAPPMPYQAAPLAAPMPMPIVAPQAAALSTPTPYQAAPVSSPIPVVPPQTVSSPIPVVSPQAVAVSPQAAAVSTQAPPLPEVDTQTTETFHSSKLDYLASKIPQQVKDTASYVTTDLADRASAAAKQVYDAGIASASSYASATLVPA